MTKAKLKQIGGDHYKNMGVEPWDVVDTWPLEQRIGAYRAGALKYLMRMGSKDECQQEIAKGIHYLEKLLEVLDIQAEESPVVELTGTAYPTKFLENILKEQRN